MGLLRLGRSKSRLVLAKNRPSGHAYAQWDIALFPVGLALARRPNVSGLEAGVTDPRA
jgi:hypothetical protein